MWPLRHTGRALSLRQSPQRLSSINAGTVKDRTVKPGVAIITDDWSAYAKLGKRGHCHIAVAQQGDMQVAEAFLLIIQLVFSNPKT